MKLELIKRADKDDASVQYIVRCDEPIFTDHKYNQDTDKYEAVRVNETILTVNHIIEKDSPIYRHQRALVEFNAYVEALRAGEMVVKTEIINLYN